jgi:dTDP-4-amino-4,6-dideoxygalactose transaminase
MKYIEEFEKLISTYFNSPYGIAVDCCTHAIELCLRYTKPKSVTSPKHTYLSVPMTYEKLGLDWKFVDDNWTEYYHIQGTNIIDAATLWKQNSYVPNTFMCISFQFKKHLKLGRGGMILTDNKDATEVLSKMRYDGRTNNLPWAEQDIDTLGYHYYMTPETAELGIKKFYEVKDMPAKVWSYQDYPDISKMSVFNAK